MQLSVWKHYIQFTLKYFFFKYFSSVVGTFYKYAKVYFIWQ